LPTIAEAIAEGASRLKASSVSEERRTAGALLCHLLGIERTHLLIRSEEPINESNYDSFLQFVERRASGEPLHYITGNREFFGLDFTVSRDVLIPRPETEFLVERVIKLANDLFPEETNPVIVDLGTGSGCIAVTLAVHLPNARLVATDISAAALEVARRNAALHNVEERIEFIEGDTLEPLARLELEGIVDFLASNPPYVNEAGSELLQREVRDWEPHRALFGGVDGLDFYQRILADGLKYIKASGYLVLEIGYGQLGPISEMIAAAAWEMVDVTPDLQGIPRTITLRGSSGKR
jgi:release factor glutamine methyltransferase